MTTNKENHQHDQENEQTRTSKVSEMSFFEHIGELRKRILYSVCSIDRNPVVTIVHKVNITNFVNFDWLKALVVEQVIDPSPSLFAPVTFRQESAGKLPVLTNTADDFLQFDFLQPFVDRVLQL